ncbi:hypothetical protein NLG97_g4253 [Lecanicillium saksenae]|uniref:Uncharacterized protein n=1 Tax=Lecanicillium saksenae TaxID=468837 RepID=A0ACC1QX64_9HYPO|nr:hypothetical protein NLG97_g4253 [Lecanicillium saksenae]
MDTIALQNASLPEAALQALAEVAARDDPAIIGIVLSGSAARGMATQNSDVDVMVIRDENAVAGVRKVSHSVYIDEIPKTLAQIETVKAIDCEGAWERWSYAWALVIKDSTGGRVSEAVRRQAVLDDAEIRHMLVELSRLDEFINYTYRALKSHRDGRKDAARLDSAECVRSMLDIVFALAGRVRPYNKYLAWELDEHPLPSAEWQDGRLLRYVTGLLDGDEAAVCGVFQAIERECLAYDKRCGRDELAAIIKGWGDQLDLHRCQL